MLVDSHKSFTRSGNRRSLWMRSGPNLHHFLPYRFIFSQCMSNTNELIPDHLTQMMDLIHNSLRGALGNFGNHNLTFFRHALFKAFFQTTMLASVSCDFVDLAVWVFLTLVVYVLLNTSSKKSLQKQNNKSWRLPITNLGIGLDTCCNLSCCLKTRANKHGLPIWYQLLIPSQ